MRISDRSAGDSGSGKYIASIDLGSHTARFLLCRMSDSENIIEPLLRKRYYTSLAHGFDENGRGNISETGIKNTLKALQIFSEIAREYRAVKICGAATGIFRRAENGDFLLNLIRKKTGIDIKTVTGEKEALYTLKGVNHALCLKDDNTVLFDLGGSTTEFIYGKNNNPVIQSLPIGALILTDRYLKKEPFKDSDFDTVKSYVYNILKKAFSDKFSGKSSLTLAGAGGTVTALAALINRITIENINPEEINGLILNIDQIEGIFEKIKPLSIPERVKLPGMDRGRAEVISAGIIAVLGIMRIFSVSQLTASYSDILEGLIISYLQGEKND